MSELHETPASQPQLSQLVQIEARGSLSRHEYFQLMTRLLSNQAASHEECVHINAIFDRVRLNQLQLVD
ncbi:MAG: hypothetical protein WBA10_19885 [Elainellaceae cyanobacterium]